MPFNDLKEITCGGGPIGKEIATAVKNKYNIKVRQL